MGWLIVVATYLVVVAFYLRLGTHALRWWEAARRAPVTSQTPPSRSSESTASRAAGTLRSAAGTIADVLLLRRLFLANPALWLGEWAFHATLALVVLRHLRYIMDPVPAWVAAAQTPGWIAGFLLPAALVYVLALRLSARRELFTATANLLMLLDVLALAATGLLLATRHRVNLVQVKAYALGTVTFRPAPPPADWLLALHLGLALALVLYVPSHVFTAPLTLLDARRRDRDRERVLHDD